MDRRTEEGTASGLSLPVAACCKGLPILVAGCLVFVLGSYLQLTRLSPTCASRELQLLCLNYICAQVVPQLRATPYKRKR